MNTIITKMPIFSGFEGTCHGETVEKRLNGYNRNWNIEDFDRERKRYGEQYFRAFMEEFHEDLREDDVYMELERVTAIGIYVRVTSEFNCEYAIHKFFGSKVLDHCTYGGPDLITNLCSFIKKNGYDYSVIQGCVPSTIIKVNNFSDIVISESMVIMGPQDKTSERQKLQALLADEGYEFEIL